MDDPSLQLEEELNSSVREALNSHRPILTHLNADTSWLIQLPFPPGAPNPLGRSRWNIILDPWFQGPQSDVARLFSTQWHTVDSSVQTMVELNQRLKEIEAIAQAQSRTPAKYGARKHSKDSELSYIDTVVVSHEFTDHCNKRTLLELDRDIPILATKRAVPLIRSWRHFLTVLEIPCLSTNQIDWRKTSHDVLPDWLGISQMVSQSDALDYHSGILVAFDVSARKSQASPEARPVAEGIIYTPHGIHAQDLDHFSNACPSISTLALLHGLHDIKLSVQRLNLGAHNGLQVQRTCQAKYWVSTHDEVKRATGFITSWLHRNVLTLQEALEEERKLAGEVGDGRALANVREVTFADLRSGESLLLV